MDYKQKIRRNLFVFVILLTFLIVGCGKLLGFESLLKLFLALAPFFLLLPIGGYYVVMKFEGRKQFLIFALWLSFVFFITSVIGMLIDDRAYPLDWIYILLVAGLVWLITFLLIVVTAPIYSAFYRSWKKH